MDLWILMNWIDISILLVCIVMLSFIRMLDHPQNNSYKKAKLFLVAFYLTGIFSILIALNLGKFQDNRIEIFNIYTLTFFGLNAFLIFYSITCLLNSCKFTQYRLFRFFWISIFFLLVHLLLSFFQPYDAVYSFEEYLTKLFHSPLLIVRTLILLSLIGASFFFIVQYIIVRHQYDEMLDNYFSNDELKKRLKWVDQICFLIILSDMVAVFSYLNGSLYFDIFYSLFIAVVSVYVTVLYINYQYEFHRIMPAVYFAEQITEEEDKHSYRINIAIEKWIGEKEKYYLKSGLTLNDVSNMTGISKRKLSEYINSQYGMTFNSWINSLRIEEICCLIIDKNNTKTLSEIAFSTGFSDLAGMSKTFKKIKGVSPSQYNNLPNKQTM